MKKLTLSFLICIFCSINAFSQYSYEIVEFNSQLSSDTEKVYAVKTDTLRIEQINSSILEICNTKYEASEEDVVVTPKVYYNSKLKNFILLLDKKVDYSIGCDVVSIKNNNYQYLGELSVAAYTKDENGRMNYNSILPFVSIVKVSDRMIFSFETPLVVIYPGMSEEATLNGRDVYYTYSKSKLELFK
ncbi:MAG: hypothetical protein IKV46_02475 [Bacteroidales bacterium]|nr:hypothetical protein [Bacteroidales bacterium]